MTTAPAQHAPATSAYDELIQRARQVDLLGGTISLLSWDREVMMPDAGLDYRSRQVAQLARWRHEQFTDSRLGDLLSACEDDDDITGDPLDPRAVNVREIRRDYERKTRLPGDLVEEEASLTSQAQHAWKQARAQSDFNMFKPWLEKMVDLQRRKAECYGWDSEGEPWDALAEDYEPGCTAADVSRVFTPLRDRLQTLLSDLMNAPNKPDNTFNEIALPVEKQKNFVRFLSESIGFDYARGRLDVSTHPFCSGTHCNDVRLTTRFHENNLNDAIGSTLHESGHGIYEQGLPEAHIGTPMGEAVSLGIHESQSRMWENQVGRSHAFWKWAFPKLREHFGDAVRDLTLEKVYGGANIVKPDFIRVEADEATYNMHIMVRFEIERSLMNGELAIGDVPDVWNARYKEYLNIDVPSDAKGCLQDIHWSMGAIGYFPTYTLGNLYCAQFFEAALDVIPDLYEQFERGDFSALKKWLNENIHAHGRRYRSADLCEHVTGQPLSADPLLRHLESKLRPLYGV